MWIHRQHPEVTAGTLVLGGGQELAGGGVGRLLKIGVERGQER